MFKSFALQNFRIIPNIEEAGYQQKFLKGRRLPTEVIERSLQSNEVFGDASNNFQTYSEWHCESTPTSIPNNIISWKAKYGSNIKFIAKHLAFQSYFGFKKIYSSELCLSYVMNKNFMISRHLWYFTYSWSLKYLPLQSFVCFANIWRRCFVTQQHDWQPRYPVPLPSQ